MPDDVLGAFAVEAIDADEFLSRGFDLHPAAALGAFNHPRKQNLSAI